EARLTRSTDGLLGRPREPADVPSRARGEVEDPVEHDPAAFARAVRVASRGNVVRRIDEPQVRRPSNAVKPVVAEGDIAVRYGDGQRCAALRPRIATDLEDVGVVGRELEVDRD